VAIVGSLVTLAPESSRAEGSSKVLVLGGTGFVGSRVVKKLKDLGLDVITTSRDGRDGTVAFDVTSAGMNVEKEIQSLSKGCTAVISCIGAIGTANDASVNSATGLAALGAKAAGVDRFVYISVAPEVKEFAKDINFLKGYMAGKTFSQDAVASNFPSGSSTLIEPTFIYGGDEFNVNPPRVAGFYGEFIEALLSSGPIRAVTNIAPDGIVKIALEPPVSVDSVANAAVAGALGKTQAVLDTHDKIKETGSIV
jgi:nucleoside-diphosphate-sugar epimerase